MVLGSDDPASYWVPKSVTFQGENSLLNFGRVILKTQEWGSGSFK